MSLTLQPWGGQLADLEVYTAHVDEDDKVYLKPSYVVIMSHGSHDTKDFAILNKDGSIKEWIYLDYGENIIHNIDYGFQTSYSTEGAGTPESYIESIDLSNYNTSKVTKMNNMFYYCENLTSLDLRKFNTSNVTSMSSMFNRCSSLTSLDLSNFNTSNVTDIRWMFYICSSLTSLDLSNFEVSKVNKMDNMFYRCDNLTHIKCKQAFKNWCIANQDEINLPTTMREGGSGIWEIVD